MPIYLLPLDTGHGIFVDESQGGTLTLPDYPGFSLTVAPNSATFPDGTRRGTITVTAVHTDKVPMVPNFGQQPRFIVTIQPPGVRFDPPARITHPNVDGLAPGEVTEIYSFDHDMGSFVATGTATVSEDGAVLVSDLGTGVVKGGWHCGGNPSPTGTAQSPSCKDEKTFRVKYAVFIDEDAIPSPGASPESYCSILPFPSGQLLLRGDFRGPRPEFTASSRGAAKATLVTRDSCDGLLKDKDRRVDQSRTYAPDARNPPDPLVTDADDDGVPNDCHLLHKAGPRPGNPAGLCVCPEPATAHKASARFRGSIKDPLVRIAPTIDWNVVVTLDSSSPSSPRFTIKGAHDGFPNHEIYIDDKLVYYFPKRSPYDLMGTLGIPVDCSGVLTPFGPIGNCPVPPP